jgi:hypothetical protein
MIGRRPRRHFGKGIANVLLHRRTKLIERSKEMIVPRLLRRMPVAHRPRVDQLVVENVVLIGAAHRRLALVGLARIARRVNQLRRRAVHAQRVLRSPVDEALRINRAAQVDMQIAALGHLLQKCQQQPRLMPHRFKILRRLLFAALRTRHLRRKPITAKNRRLPPNAGFASRRCLQPPILTVIVA